LDLIRGAHICSNETNINTTIYTPRSFKHKLSTGEKAGAAARIGVAAIIMLTLAMLFLKRRYLTEKKPSKGDQPRVSATPQLSSGGHHEKTELEAREEEGELAAGSTARDIDSQEVNPAYRARISRKPLPLARAGPTRDSLEIHEMQ